MMHVVYVVEDHNWVPVAWFMEEERANDYAAHLGTEGGGEFAKVRFQGELYIAGSYYEEGK